MAQSVDWNDLRYVLALARGRSLASAARLLHVDPSSVHRRLVALERQLSVRLFERKRDGYRPTRQGEALAEAASRMEAEVLAAERKLLGSELRLSGLIRVSTSELLGLHLLPPLLREFASRFPEVVIAVSLENRLVDLARRDADVVIRGTDKPPQHLVGRRVAKIASCAYGQRAYLDRVGRDRPLEDYEWLGFDETIAQVPQARWLRARLPDASCRFVFNSIEAMRRAAQTGAGVAVLPAFVGDLQPDLERITEPELSGEFGVHVLTHPDLRRSARVGVFMREMIASIATQERRLLGVSG
jgi:DNA-binding transcriptional LysR family regulator